MCVKTLHSDDVRNRPLSVTKVMGRSTEQMICAGCRIIKSPQVSEKNERKHLRRSSRLRREQKLEDTHRKENNEEK
jgi:hypothetical protein